MSQQSKNKQIQKLFKFITKALDNRNEIPYNSRPQTMSRLQKRRRRLHVEDFKQVFEIIEN